MEQKNLGIAGGARRGGGLEKTFVLPELLGDQRIVKRIRQVARMGRRGRICTKLSPIGVMHLKKENQARKLQGGGER